MLTPKQMARKKSYAKDIEKRREANRRCAKKRRARLRAETLSNDEASSVPSSGTPLTAAVDITSTLLTPAVDIASPVPSSGTPLTVAVDVSSLSIAIDTSSVPSIATSADTVLERRRATNRLCAQKRRKREKASKESRNEVSNAGTFDLDSACSSLGRWLNEWERTELPAISLFHVLNKPPFSIYAGWAEAIASLEAPFLANRCQQTFNVYSRHVEDIQEALCEVYSSGRDRADNLVWTLNARNWGDFRSLPAVMSLLQKVERDLAVIQSFGDLAHLYLSKSSQLWSQ